MSLNVTNNASGVWVKIRTICCIIPVIVTILWILSSVADIPNWIQDYIMLPLLGLGYLAALIACPLEIFKTIFSFLKWGWKVGWAIPFFPINAILALSLAALAVGVSVIFLAYAPAVITLYVLFRDRVKNDI